MIVDDVYIPRSEYNQLPLLWRIIFSLQLINDACLKIKLRNFSYAWLAIVFFRLIFYFNQLEALEHV